MEFISEQDRSRAGNLLRDFGGIVLQRVQAMLETVDEAIVELPDD